MNDQEKPDKKEPLTEPGKKEPQQDPNKQHPDSEPKKEEPTVPEKKPIPDPGKEDPAKPEVPDDPGKDVPVVPVKGWHFCPNGGYLFAKSKTPETSGDAAEDLDNWKPCAARAFLLIHNFVIHIQNS